MVDRKHSVPRSRPAVAYASGSLGLLALLALLVAGGCSRPSQEVEPGAHTLAVTLGSRTFELELALTPEQRYQGLSDRPSIAADGGMLFVFPDARELAFVMRRCQAPIDIIFIGPGGHVVAMHEMQVEPADTPEEKLRRYGSGWPAQFAIELAGGTLRQLSLTVGEHIPLPLAQLKQMARQVDKP